MRRLVVQVAPYLPPHLGGMEVVVSSISEVLAEDGPVEVLTSRSGARTEAVLDRRGRLVIRRLPTWEVAHLPVMPTLLWHLLRYPREALFHVHVAQAYVPEMVWLASRLRRRPFIAHFHLDVAPSGRLGWVFAIYKRLVLGRTLRAAARVIALSSEQADFLVARYGVESALISVIPNGVAAGFSHVVRAARPAGPLRLLYVGRLSPQKNVARLLHAMALVSAPVELVVVGDGEERAQLERLALELGLANTTMVGAQRGESLVAWYGWADVFVLPSDKEGMPLVLLEAMAAGLPVLATDVVGTRDTVGDHGLLVRPDPGALAEGIDRLARDPALRAQLGDRSRRRENGLTWPAVVERLESVYERVSS